MEERREEIDGVGVLWREAPATGTPVLYVHGVPTDGGDWLPFLERTGGLAPDLPGFGRSDKPPHFEYSIAGYDRFLEAFLAARGVERFSLVVHDWGAVGLALAQRSPERIHRLVVLDAVPFLPGYRWHPIARMWRRPVAGELFMGFTTKWGMRMLARRSRSLEMPDELLDRVWPHFDHGTQRAILRLYRSAPPDELERAGANLAAIAAPALVIWGERDPFLPGRFADAYAEALGDGRVEHVAGAGHWPWLDDPTVINRVCAHLGA
jgi:pimeloyl-ACP methyl ester carboxylesterase